MRPQCALGALGASESFRIDIFRRFCTLYCLINFQEQWWVCRGTLGIDEECASEEVIGVHLLVILKTEGRSVERIRRELPLKDGAEGATQ